MGDSGMALRLSVLALLLVVGALVAFVVAWRVRRRVVRLGVGILLLGLAAACAVFSVLAVLRVAGLGVGALVLAFRTR
jgi:hypothetical protein